MRHTKRSGWPYSQPPNVQFEINRASPQSHRLIAWWPMLASRGATMLRDMSRHGLDAQFPGGVANPSWISDVITGWALDTDGNNDYVTLGTNVIGALTEGTICCWIKANTNPINNAMAYSIVEHTVDLWWRFGFGIYQNVGVLTWQLRFFDGAAWRDASAVGPVLTTWYHMIGTWSVTRNDAELYVDGISVATSGACAGAPATGGSLMLARDAENARFFDGTFADLRIYDRAFTDTEAWQLYAEPWELYKPLIRRWTGWKSLVVERIPRYGFTNFQVPGIV